ncbi:hypothetical protein H4R99_000315 [Coemansia sp. RSA 1722]|nr:hypothetical protein LPJ57_003114 [Coemansia sp. RSA 486]KAJ2227775.1 hypothetical protein IWW45_006885 [Coemansia sp. RSA 485]KAJ2606483.1 hypothetical protein H4R99_000315 [Coemansia sp. RSA 1722]KAJ2638829.1 hypothetical protein GGF40_001370 [Coemansia sp. RSA 1286]
MKLCFETSFIYAISVACLANGAYASSIFDRIKWPWSSKSNEDMPIPGSSPFDPDVSAYSPRCFVAMANLKSKFDMTCYQGSKSLYFSSPGEICTPKCLNTTIELSQYVVKQCGLESRVPPPSEPVGYNHKNFVYLSWADKDMSSLICNGPQQGDKQEDWSQPARCYSAVFTAETIRETDALANNSGVGKENVCNQCTKEWVDKLRNGKYHISPLLYYGHIPNAPHLAAWISEQCGYNMTPF